MSKYRGIDVSNWSGTIDWESVANSGVEAVIIQASEGTFYRDPYLQEFYDGARRNNLKIGFYHFLILDLHQHQWNKLDILLIQ